MRTCFVSLLHSPLFHSPSSSPFRYLFAMIKILLKQKPHKFRSCHNSRCALLFLCDSFLRSVYGIIRFDAPRTAGTRAVQSSSSAPVRFTLGNPVRHLPHFYDLIRFISSQEINLRPDPAHHHQFKCSATFPCPPVSAYAWPAPDLWWHLLLLCSFILLALLLTSFVLFALLLRSCNPDSCPLIY